MREHDDDCANRRGLECDCGLDECNTIKITHDTGRTDSKSILDEMRVHGYESEKFYVPQEQCPIDYLIDMGSLTRNYQMIILSKPVATDIAFGRLPKTMTRNGNEVTIEWTQTGETLYLLEIGETHDYVVSAMYMREGNYVCGRHYKGTSKVLYLKR